MNKMLTDRASAHGEFTENSRATWAIIESLQMERNWPLLPDHMKHSLYMIAHKMARVVAGDPNEQDHWADIAGYAQLVADRIRHPVIPYGGADDIYAGLAIFWGVTRDEAQRRAIGLARAARDERQKAEAVTARRQSLFGKPGTPEDGGHHAAASDTAQDVEGLAKDLEIAVKEQMNEEDRKEPE